jgi:hypothetical protein
MTATTLPARLFVLFAVAISAGIFVSSKAALSASKELVCRPALRDTDCSGDCDCSGSVTIDELVNGLKIAVGDLSPAACRAIDRNDDGMVQVDEIVRAAGAIFEGCYSTEDGFARCALRYGRCTQRGGLRICPTDYAPSGEPPPPSDVPLVVIVQDDPCSTPCVQVEGACVVTLTFGTIGFAAAITFLVAHRSQEGAPWLIEPWLTVVWSPAGPLFESRIAVGGQSSVQFAVLAFAEPPPSVPAEVNELAESGAEEAFVTPVVGVVPDAPEPGRNAK